ncbi:MAG: hypothetical protein WA057_00585 [Candidatus Magasanikiibacteriota bacterium]
MNVRALTKVLEDAMVTTGTVFLQVFEDRPGFRLPVDNLEVRGGSLLVRTKHAHPMFLIRDIHNIRVAAARTTKAQRLDALAVDSDPDPE